jgi:hypothetical protein
MVAAFIVGFAGQVFGDGARVNFHAQPGGTPCGFLEAPRGPTWKKLQQPVEDALKTTPQRAPNNFVFFITFDIPEGRLPV